MAEWYSIVQTPVFTVHQMSEQLGYFHIMAAVNSARNTGVRVFSELWLSLAMCPGVGLLDHTHGCLRRPYKYLRKEEKERQGERRYAHLECRFQRIARRGKKSLPQ